jgi:hypothetical protein
MDDPQNKIKINFQENSTDQEKNIVKLSHIRKKNCVFL